MRATADRAVMTLAEDILGEALGPIVGQWADAGELLHASLEQAAADPRRTTTSLSSQPRKVMGCSRIIAPKGP
jgi:hypothetical protein